MRDGVHAVAALHDGVADFLHGEYLLLTGAIIFAMCFETICGIAYRWAEW